MTNQSMATALTFSCFAFSLSVLPITARAEQCVTRGLPPQFCHRSAAVACELDEYAKAKISGGGCISGYQWLCCKLGDENKGYTTTAPVNPCEAEGPGYEYSAKAKGCIKKAAVKPPLPPCPEGQIRREGKCQQVGVLPGSTTGKKGGFIQMKPGSCAEGYKWSESENNCIKKPSQVKAECEAKGNSYDLDTGRCVKSIKKAEPQVAEPEVVTQQPKKKRKKKKESDDDD